MDVNATPFECLRKQIIFLVMFQSSQTKMLCIFPAFYFPWSHTIWFHTFLRLVIPHFPYDESLLSNLSFDPILHAVPLKLNLLKIRVFFFKERQFSILFFAKLFSCASQNALCAIHRREYSSDSPH